MTTCHVSKLLPTNDCCFVQSRREPPYLVFSASKTTRMRASDFLQGQPMVNICLREVIERQFRHRHHIPSRLRLRVANLASGARIRSLHLEGFRLREKKPRHILNNSQPSSIDVEMLAYRIAVYPKAHMHFSVLRSSISALESYLREALASPVALYSIRPSARDQGECFSSSGRYRKDCNRLGFSLQTWCIHCEQLSQIELSIGT